MNKCITILSFSSREHGNCANISNYISNYFQANVRSYIIDGESIQPCGKCDYQCLKGGEVCPRLDDRLKEIMDAVCSSVMVYFVVPNFCGYPCANYFAFNERSVGYFGMDRTKMKAYMDVPKRFIIVSNTEGFEAAMRQQTNTEPDILYMKSGKYKKRSIAGDILESDEAKTDLEQFLAKAEFQP